MTKKKTPEEKAADKAAKAKKSAEKKNAAVITKPATPTAIPDLKETTGLTYDEAMAELKEGGAGFVKLPEWGGYWKYDLQLGKIMVVTKDGVELDTPHHDVYSGRNDWEITDGLAPEIVTPFVPETTGIASASDDTETAIADTDKIQAKEERLEMPEMSTSFEKNLPNIKAGKKMLLDSEPGFHFILVGERLEKRSDGGLIDSAPLYSYQDRGGWKVAK